MYQMTQSLHFLGAPEGSGQTTLSPRVSNADVADVLFNIATLLEMQQDNPYRIAAYRNAARGVLAQREPVASVLARGERLQWPGLGDRLRRKIGELVTTGRMIFFDELCESSLPEDVRALMAIPHVGPRTALRLVEKLDIHSIPELLDATQAHRVRHYYRFGPRSEERLRVGAIAALADHSSAA